MLVWALAPTLLLSACVYEEKLTDGPSAFDRKQYAVAADFFKKDVAKSANPRERGKLSFQIGECYRRMNRPDDAATWYKKAYDDVYPGSAIQYALALKQTEQYDEAASAFTEAGRELGSVGEYQKQIQACKAAKRWLAEADKSTFKVSALPVNGKFADFAPTLAPEGKLLFTSDRPEAQGDEQYGWTGNAFSDLFLVDPTDAPAQNLGAPVNTPYNEGAACYNADYTELFFTRCGSDGPEEVQFCHIFRALLGNDGRWGMPEQLTLGPPNANYGHPYLSPDGRALLFSSDRTDGTGGFDLYITFRLNEGGWAEPRNLGNGINTEGDEKFPFLDADTLYFASDGHVGMGGLDLYRAVKTNAKFGNATNLKAPINSGADDFGLVIDRRKPYPNGVVMEGYFASARNTGQGNDDLYRFQKIVPPPAPVELPKPPVAYRLVLEGFTREIIRTDRENPNSDIDRYQPMPNVTVTVQSEDTSFILRSNSEGTFTFLLKEDRDYRFTATLDGYLTGKGSITTRGFVKDPDNPEIRIPVELNLDKIIKNREIVLENIYYDFDKWDIREDAKPTLNALVGLLQENPNIKIELGSHTDCRGNDAYNLTLSQKRAESAVAYLLARGIDPARVSARGYGETVPVATCDCRRCTEEQHQANRRTTFKIV